MSESASNPKSPPAAIVTCVEAGYLETQTIRMIESLRRWGGRLANCPVLAIKPRCGAPIRKPTLDRYRDLGVQLHSAHPTTAYTWYNFINKPVALLEAEQHTNAPVLIWLDADILIMAEPAELLLEGGEDFAACPTDKNIGTAGDTDPYQPYWQAMCHAIGISLDDVPWTTVYREKLPIRAYFNGGVIAYRPTSGYARTYFDVCRKILDAYIAIKNDGYFYHEQAAVGLAMAAAKLRWKPLSESHNYAFGSRTLQFVDPEQFRKAKVLHYHRSMRPEFWPKFLEYFATDLPEVHRWLEPFGPLDYNLPLPSRVMNKLIRMARNRRAEKYKANCRLVA